MHDARREVRHGDCGGRNHGIRRIAHDAGQRGAIHLCPEGHSVEHEQGNRESAEGFHGLSRYGIAPTMPRRRCNNDVAAVPVATSSSWRSTKKCVNRALLTLEDHFFARIKPRMEQALAEGRRDAWPLVVLPLDFKTNEAAHMRRMARSRASSKMRLAGRCSAPASSRSAPRPVSCASHACSWRTSDAVAILAGCRRAACLSAGDAGARTRSS